MTSLGIISSKGGVGKTTAAINIAISIADKGQRVTLLDADFSSPSVGLYLGYPHLKNTLQKALNGEASLRQSIYLHPSGIQIVPGERGNYHHGLPIEKLIAESKDLSDIVIVDSRTGHGNETFSVINHADHLLFLMSPDASSVHDARESLSRIRSMGKEVYGLILTPCHMDKLELSQKEVESSLSCSVLAEIPYDVSVREAISMKHPLAYSHPTSPAARAYRRLASWKP